MNRGIKRSPFSQKSTSGNFQCPLQMRTVLTWTAISLSMLASACNTDEHDVFNTEQPGDSAGANPSSGRETADSPVISDPVDHTEPGTATPDEPLEVVSPASPANTVFTPAIDDIRDHLPLYNSDGYGEIDVVRIDIVTQTEDGVCTEDDQSGCTLDDVKGDIDSRDTFKVDIPVHFSAADFADDGSISNATLRQRGGGTRAAPQKSFRIKLDDKDQLWRSERHLQLNKHPFDSTRIRNKLSFDLMQDIPHLPSFRTQFVNLWVDDGAGPVDYGLFTHVERADERYLKRRGMDDKARLYKAEFFRFRKSDRATLLIDAQGSPLNTDRFETVLEIENGKDHRPLIAMLDALHDPQTPFQSVMDRFFNENNVLTWIAVNLLIGQQDATRHNYFLYNPHDSEKFYFLPWDYDFTFLEHVEPANELTSAALFDRLKYGYADGAKNEFIEAYFRQPGAHEKIVAAADELRSNFLDNARVADLTASLTSATAPFITSAPDRIHNPAYTIDASADFADKVAFNHNALTNAFSLPMPPTLLTPELVNGRWRIRWLPAHELTGQPLSYELQIASSPGFNANEILLQRSGLSHSSEIIEYWFDASELPFTGTRYLRLIVRAGNEPARFWQIADNELTVNGETFYGMIRLE